MSWTVEQCKMWADWAKEHYAVPEEEMEALRAYAEAYKKSQASAKALESKEAANDNVH